MKTTNEFKAFVRAPFAFPGGYEIHAVMSDGGCLCHTCAKDNAKLIIADTRSDARSGCGHSGWEFYAADINWEDDNLFCDHCGNQLKPEYGME